MSYQSPIPNINMASGFAYAVTAVNPADIKSYPLHSIAVDEGARKRPLNRGNVEQIKDSISKHGLLQPIGLKRMGSGNPYKLVFGLHRFLAILELTNEAVQRGESIANMGGIPAIMFPEDTPDWQIELAEVSENLMRKELNADERAAHTLLYAGLVKKSGRVATAKEKNGDGGKKGMAIRYDAKSVASRDTLKKPTVTEAVATDLGISKSQVHARVKKATAAIGGAPITIETADADTLIDLGHKAMAVAPDTHKARWKKNHDAAQSAKSIRKPAVSAPSVPEYDDNDEPINELSEAIDEVLSTLKSVERLHGMGVVQEAIKRWWKEKHPQGRVPFQTTSK